MTNNNEEILIAIMEEVQDKINDIHSIMQNILIEEAADDLEEKIMYLYHLRAGLDSLTNVLEKIEENLLENEEKDDEEFYILREKLKKEYKKSRKKKKSKKKAKKKSKTENSKNKKNREKNENLTTDEKEERKINGVQKIGDLWIL
ncbi:hypothetical protein [Dialister micraerophilus]|uniref:hypothetical protein n=1 Tax=Dialister micraerophilus TaxID=309120 RepID=UPI0023F34619|nr:hypothetical protein [Dialister micraerophilus]